MEYREFYASHSRANAHAEQFLVSSQNAVAQLVVAINNILKMIIYHNDIITFPSTEIIDSKRSSVSLNSNDRRFKEMLSFSVPFRILNSCLSVSFRNIRSRSLIRISQARTWPLCSTRWISVSAQCLMPKT